MLSKTKPKIEEEKRDGDELLALVSRAASGDEDAFAALVAKYEKLIYNLCYQYTQNREDAADVSQEVFLKLWRSLSTFRGESSFSTWLFRIAQNSALDYLRKRAGSQTVSLTCTADGEDEEGREHDIVDTDTAHDPAASYDRLETREAVQAAIAALGTDHREILVLRDMRGYSYTEIADMLGLEMGTVKSRISRARMQIKDFLEARNIF